MSMKMLLIELMGNDQLWAMNGDILERWDIIIGRRLSASQLKKPSGRFDSRIGYADFSHDGSRLLLTAFEYRESGGVWSTDGTHFSSPPTASGAGLQWTPEQLYLQCLTADGKHALNVRSGKLKRL